MSKSESMEHARAWLRKVRGDGDAGAKRAFLMEKGFDDQEIEDLLEWDREDEVRERPLFGE